MRVEGSRNYRMICDRPSYMGVEVVERDAAEVGS